MSRLDTMARFEEPEDEEVLTKCEVCNEDLCCGASVFKFDGVHFCSVECIINWVAPEEIVLSKDTI